MIFSGLTIVLLASNEQKALEETIKTIINTDQFDDIFEIIIFLKSSDCDSADTAKKLQEHWQNRIHLRVCVQKSASLQKALSELPALIESSHFLIMSSDLEMDALSIPKMLQISKRIPDAIVCAAKWHPDSKIYGYGTLHKIGSVLMNRIAAAIIQNDSSDLFSTFQIYPLIYISKYSITQPRSFLYEFTLKPVCYGEKYIEIPTLYKKRSEGKSHFFVFPLFKVALGFIFTSIRLCFERPNSLRRRNDREEQ